MKTIVLDIGDESADWIKSVSKRAPKPAPKPEESSYLTDLKALEKALLLDAKKAAAAGEFVEDEHPRGEGGKFVLKGEGVAPKGDEVSKEVAIPKREPSVPNTDSVKQYKGTHLQKRTSPAPEIDYNNDPDIVKNGMKSEKFAVYIQKTPPEYVQSITTYWLNEINHKTTLGKDAAEWDKKVAAGISTKTLNEIDGKYTPERMERHKAISDTYFKKVKKPDQESQPTLYLFGGGMATGKGGLKQYVPNIDEKLWISNDDIKSLLPESTRTNSTYVHHEAKDIVTEMYELGLEQKQSMIIDGTLRDIGAIKKVIADAHKEGFKVVQFSTNAPLEDSESRSANRFLGLGEEGRYVPADIIGKDHDNANAAQFEVLEHADEGAIFDNDVGRGEPFKLITYKGVKPTIQKEAKPYR